MFWAFGPNFYEAIRQYYLGLVNAGLIKKKVNSARKNAAALAPQWCTWGEQVARHKEGGQFDEATLTTMYDELKASGLQAAMFSIDDKWEGAYGSLEHDAQRFPHFEQFLDGLRADGHRVGIWAAFMRCEDPASLGLTTDDMLHRAGGEPYKAGKYYLLDFTRPKVAAVLHDLAVKFVRRYKPDLVKFDFGYEIPALDSVAPHDMNWAGERMLWKGLEVVTKAMREENPDIR
jgi:alpha-galactosidase